MIRSIINATIKGKKENLRLYKIACFCSMLLVVFTKYGRCSGYVMNNQPGDYQPVDIHAFEFKGQGLRKDTIENDGISNPMPNDELINVITEEKVPILNSESSPFNPIDIVTTTDPASMNVPDTYEAAEMLGVDEDIADPDGCFCGLMSCISGCIREIFTSD